MVTGFSNGESGRRDVLPILGQQMYTCSFCPATFTNLHARGGHMTKHRQEVLENRRKHEEYMANKHREFTMELLSPNKAYWRRYRKGNIKSPEIDFVPLKKPRVVPEDVELSRFLLTSKGVMTDLAIENKDKGAEVEFPSVDLTLKL